MPTNKRNIAIDIIRGFAVLGIFIMNVQSIGMNSAAYQNPLIGNQNKLDLIIWSFNHIIADQKFMNIFSMLFGVGIIIFMDNAIQKGLHPLKIFYKRLFGLFIIGLLHAYLLWYGDILVSYALCGIIAALFHKSRSKTLFMSGFLFIVFGAFISLLSGLDLLINPISEMELAQEIWHPDSTYLETEILAYRSGWMAQMPYRIESALFVQTLLFISWSLWRVTGLMLLGMGLYRSRFFESSFPKKTLYKIIYISFVPGLIGMLIGLFLNFYYKWQVDFSLYFGNLFNYFASLGISLTYITLVLLVLRHKGFKLLRLIFSALGRTALSNYILQSILATLFFYGHGAGYFAVFSRLELWFVVLIVWLIQILVSLFWLRYFPMGPIEYTWRKYTYSKIKLKTGKFI